MKLSQIVLDGQGRQVGQATILEDGSIMIQMDHYLTLHLGDVLEILSKSRFVRGVQFEAAKWREVADYLRMKFGFAAAVSWRMARDAEKIPGTSKVALDLPEGVLPTTLPAFLSAAV